MTLMTHVHNDEYYLYSFWSVAFVDPSRCVWVWTCFCICCVIGTGTKLH